MKRCLHSPFESLHWQPTGRPGKLLVAFALVLTSLFAVIAYYIDGSMMLLSSRVMQNSADAAATAAAFSIMNGSIEPEQVADDLVRNRNAHSNATVTTHVPPATGEFDGVDGYVEVIVQQPYDGYFLRAAGLTDPVTLRVRSVAGIEPTTRPAAVVVLDPAPSPISLGPLPITLPSVSPLIGGLEVIGLGRLEVDGAIHVNNTWGGYDESGDPVGDSSPLLASACTCTPVLPLTRVRAPDIRVVGGVDDPRNYSPLNAEDPSPLRANRRPVPDPLSGLPVPSTLQDSTNVHPDEYGGVTFVGIPIVSPSKTFKPGVYEWIDIAGGRVEFEPGVYIIRGQNPLTGISLTIVGATVEADGILFYVTDSPTFSPDSGTPDSLDEPVTPPTVSSLVPSVVIGNLLAHSRFSPINDSDSPFDGMLLFQRRQDRRPIILAKQDLLGHSHFAGNVYAKWSNVVLAGNGPFQSAFVSGSLRVITAFQIRIAPLAPLPPAHDVFLVE